MEEIVHKLKYYIMNEDDSDKISIKTWCRSVELVQKLGYMDGASDGQATVFQSSFDTGFEQGFKFGLEIGSNDSEKRLTANQNTTRIQLTDPRRINCQVCVNSTASQENVGNLYNTQKEANDKYINAQ